MQDALQAFLRFFGLLKAETVGRVPAVAGFFLRLQSEVAVFCDSEFFLEQPVFFGHARGDGKTVFVLRGERAFQPHFPGEIEAEFQVIGNILRIQRNGRFVI